MGGGEGGMIWENDIETCIISYMKQIANSSSMQDNGCLGLVAGYWYTGTTQRDGTGREEGGGTWMGKKCISVVDSCRCIAKPIQYCKVIKLQLK